jgi:hypothetical protein
VHGGAPGTSWRRRRCTRAAPAPVQQGVGGRHGGSILALGAARGRLGFCLRLDGDGENRAGGLGGKTNTRSSSVRGLHVLGKGGLGTGTTQVRWWASSVLFNYFQNLSYFSLF